MRDHLSWRLTRHTRSPTRIAGNAGWATSASLPRTVILSPIPRTRRMECEPCRRCHGANRCRDRLCLRSDGSPSRPYIVAGDPHGLLYAQRVSRPPRARRLRGTPRHDPDWRRVAWPERGRGRPVRNPRRKKKRCHLHGGVTGSTRGRPSPSARRCGLSFGPSGRMPARRWASSTQAPVPNPREEVLEAHGLPLPGLRSAGCAKPLSGS
jgi:hypothetical protein